MHPDTLTPNPRPFATARGWEPRTVTLDTPAFESESSPVHSDLFPPVTPAFRVRQIRRTARRWQIGLVIGLIVLAPALSGALYLSITTLPACPTEDSVSCHWDGGPNGLGRSFDVDGAGNLTYTDR